MTLITTLQKSFKTAIGIAALSISAIQAAEKPNIIFVLTDDQPYEYLGVTGNTIVKTPNIDQMANDGMLFTNAHVTSAICTPSRVSIALGQYERKHAVNFNSGTSVSEKAWDSSYPMLMRKAGYYTGWIGKNHIPAGDVGYTSGLMEKSFDYWYAAHGHMRFYSKEHNKIFSEAKSDTQVEIINDGIDDFLNPRGHQFKNAVKSGVKRTKDQPFMLSININLPHSSSTRVMEQRPTDDVIYRTLYRDQEIPLSRYYVARKDIKTPKLPASILHAEDRQTGYNYVDTPEDAKEIMIRQYQAMTGIDRLIGNLRKKLEEIGEADNTIIIMTSDHGLFMGEHGLGGKALCYEKVTHVPVIIYDPRHKPTSNRSTQLVSTVDIAPTILSMGGVALPKTFQGEDLSPVFYEDQPLKRKYSYSENLWSTHFGNPRCESVQDQGWKYIRYYANNNLSATTKLEMAKKFKIKTGDLLYGVRDTDMVQYFQNREGPLKGEPAVYEELYNYGVDPMETTNLVNDPKYQAKLDELRAAWKPAITHAFGTEFPSVNRYNKDIGKGYASK